MYVFLTLLKKSKKKFCLGATEKTSEILIAIIVKSDPLIEI